jgi:hypothetical protein
MIHAMLKINLDNYHCYLLVRVWIFKSSRYDFLPCSFLKCVIWSQQWWPWYVCLLIWWLWGLKWSIGSGGWQHSCSVWMFVDSGHSLVIFGSWQTHPYFAWKVSCMQKQGRDIVRGLYWWKNTNKTKFMLIIF